MLSNLPPLILTQTPLCNYLAMRGSNVVLKLSDDAVLWLKEQGDKGEFSEQFKRLFKENWQFDKLPSIGDAIHFREKAISGYTDASYELNMACNYSCEHCYLDERKNKKLDLNDRKKLFEIMSQSGVIRLHMSGGEPLIDKGFKETYRMAQEAGFLIRLSSNGYALGREDIVELFQKLPPTRIAVSLYGASAKSYEGLTRTPPGTYKKFCESMSKASKANINVRVKIIVTKHNEDELEDMKRLVDGFGFEYHVYNRMAATLLGNGDVLDNQAKGVDLRSKRMPFAGCGAGKMFFHSDPLGRGSICMTGRDKTIDILKDGVNGILDLSGISDNLMKRKGECSGCSLAASCSTCPVIVDKYRLAKADKAFFCQHN